MLHDNISVYDELQDDYGNIIASSDHGGDIIGEVEILYKSKHNGKAMFTRRIRRNELLVTGAVFMSEKINGVRSTFKTIPLDVEIGVHSADQVQVDSSTVPVEKICGIMVGNGGCSSTYNEVHPVKRTDRVVPGYLPFRVVKLTDDLSATDRKNYFLRVVRGEYAYYYGKKFTTEREINVQFEDGTTVPTNVDTTTVKKFVKTFTKFRAIIDSRDIREYFKITQGSTMKSLINSLGLVTGYPGVTEDGVEEFFNVRTLTTLNMENSELKDSESTIEVNYQLNIV